MLRTVLVAVAAVAFTGAAYACPAHVSHDQTMTPITTAEISTPVGQPTPPATN